MTQIQPRQRTRHHPTESAQVGRQATTTQGKKGSLQKRPSEEAYDEHHLVKGAAPSDEGSKRAAPTKIRDAPGTNPAKTRKRSTRTNSSLKTPQRLRREKSASGDMMKRPDEKHRETGTSPGGRGENRVVYYGKQTRTPPPAGSKKERGGQREYQRPSSCSRSTRKRISNQGREPIERGGASRRPGQSQGTERGDQRSRRQANRHRKNPTTCKGRRKAPGWGADKRRAAKETGIFRLIVRGNSG